MTSEADLCIRLHKNDKGEPTQRRIPTIVSLLRSWASVVMSTFWDFSEVIFRLPRFSMCDAAHCKRRVQIDTQADCSNWVASLAITPY